MLHYRIYENNSIFGVFYMFPEIGDQLPMHDHAQGRKHNVIVLKGSVDVYGPDRKWEITLNVGDVFDFNDPEHYPHEITCLVPGTEILAIAVDGKHPDDIDLTHGISGTLLKDASRPPMPDTMKQSIRLPRD